MTSAHEALVAFSAAVDAGDTVIDLSGVGEYDSALLSALLETSRHAGARGQALKCVNPPPKLSRLAQLYGVESLLFGK
jgi:phospholipid transport system transporter-binding protein